MKNELLLNWKEHSIPNSGQSLSLSFPWIYSKLTNAAHIHFILIWEYCVCCFGMSACWWTATPTMEILLIMAFTMAFTITFICCCKFFSWASGLPIWIIKAWELDMFTACFCQSNVLSTVPSVCAVAGWDPSAESEPFSPHINSEATQCPPRDLGFSKGCKIQVLGTAFPSNLVSLERIRDVKNRAEFNTSKVWLQIVWGFWKNPTWCSRELIAKNGN